ncbi:glycosyltransferase family 2 protein [Lactobacillus sp. ESL0791]|uniref:glycosyltransferase family 2 protein n=1 Tax=Lactobacillus sp. ESL0791 TaxID=2983234 RepID=UPI0023FA1E26|nr:glycosyltransferase family 2 protein [Lactobacillus sp. ESL0791]MDF7639225.1 glycosyltransferase family 2 protein [Lactobacillus sp. ESL0791]
MKVQVSLIVAAYNEERLLPRCLTSLAQQDFTKKYEVIVVDDGSTDKTPAIIQKYIANYPEIFKSIRQKNSGQAVARNNGLKIARGKYLGFTDADDWVEPDYISALYANIEKYQSDVAVCDVHKIFVDQNKEKDVRTLPCAEGLIAVDAYMTVAESNSYSWNKLYRREIWQSFQFKQMVYEDLDILLPIISCCRRLSYVPQPLYNYYKHDNSTTSSYLNPRLFDIFTAYRDLINDTLPVYRQEAQFCAVKRILRNMKTPGFRYYLSYFIAFLQEMDLDNNDLLRSNKFAAALSYYRQVQLLPDNFYFTSTIVMQNWQHYGKNDHLALIDSEQTLLQKLEQDGGIVVLTKSKLASPFGFLRALNNFVVWDDQHQCMMLGLRPHHPLLQYLLSAEDESDLSAQIKEIFDHPVSSAALLFDVQVLPLSALQKQLLLQP